MLVSFDFDSTLKTAAGRANVKICNQLRAHLENGDKVYIISERENTREDCQEILTFLRVNCLAVAGWDIHLLEDNHDKIAKILELRINMHYDDDEDVIEQLNATPTIAVNSFTRQAAREYAEVFLTQP